MKHFLGRSGAFDGDDILRIILEQEQTAIYIASKLYRFFVRDSLTPDYAVTLGALLRDGDYEIAPFLTTLVPVEGLLQRGLGRHPYQVVRPN